jgi:hypothetical protein
MKLQPNNRTTKQPSNQTQRNKVERKLSSPSHPTGLDCYNRTTEQPNSKTTQQSNPAE